MRRASKEVRELLGLWGSRTVLCISDIEEAFSVYNLSHCLEGKDSGEGVKKGRGTGLEMTQKAAEKRQKWQ